MGETTGKKRTYTVAEIREIMGISRPAAYNLVKKNFFRSVRVGNQIRISKESFDQWLEGNASQVGTDTEKDLLLLLKLLQKPEMAEFFRAYDKVCGYGRIIETKIQRGEQHEGTNCHHRFKP